MDAALLSRIDISQLAENLGGDIGTLRRMLVLYLEQSQQDLATIEQALKTNNVLQWKRSLHSFKGASQNITARRLASLCAEGEAITALPHESADALLYHLQKEYAMVRGTITALSSPKK